MRIIILAAGRGERLMPLTKNTPKPLIDMGNGNTLIEEQIQSIVAAGAIKEIILVVGYLAEQVEAKIQAYAHGNCIIRTIFNPLWQVSNNLISLWLARHEFENEDVMITNGDNIFAPEVFSDFALHGQGIWLAVSPKDDFDEDDMKVSIDNGLITAVSKRLPSENASAESPGLAMVRGDRSRNFFIDNLNAAVRDPARINSFWLETFNCLWQKGIPINPWLIDLRGKWQEVDFHPDVHLARSLIAGKIKDLNERNYK